MKEVSMKKLLIISVILVMALLVDPLPVQCVTKVLVVPPSAMRPQDSYVNSLDWYAYDDEFYFDTGYPDPVRGNAPIYLPHGSYVKKLIVYYTDNGTHPDEEIGVYLYRQEMATGAYDQMAAVSSSTKPANPGRRVLKDHTINYDVISYNYSYTLMIRFYVGHDNVRFHGAIIIYEE
jgi:hypothetical protein